MGKSHQRGWVVARGKKWYGYYRRTVLDPVTNSPVTDVVTIVLGLKARLTKSEAREELQKEIAQQTGQHVNGRVMKDGSITFGWFVRNRYLPLREANWKPETAKVKKIQIQRDLVDKFENVPMDAIDKFMLQTHINRLARFCSTDRVLQARSYLKSIFSEAVEQDFLLKDPSHKVTAPLNLRKKDKTVLTWDQLRLVLATLIHRDRALLTLEMTEALRPSELFALRWRSLEGSKLTITETVYKERSGRGARHEGVWATFTFRQDWRTSFGFGNRNVLTLRRMRSSFRTQRAGASTRAITATASWHRWLRNWDYQS